MEWFVTCARKGCEQVKAVRSRAQQRKQKYCSRHCAGIMHNFTQQERRRGAATSAKVRRAAAMDALASMSKIEIARRYYSRGWHQGRRSTLAKAG